MYFLIVSLLTGSVIVDHAVVICTEIFKPVSTEYSRANEKICAF
jgi:hypothetical protein